MRARQRKTRRSFASAVARRWIVIFHQKFSLFEECCPSLVQWDFDPWLPRLPCKAPHDLFAQRKAEITPMLELFMRLFQEKHTDGDPTGENDRAYQIREEEWIPVKDTTFSEYRGVAQRGLSQSAAKRRANN